jgi:hypothetical protein
MSFPRRGKYPPQAGYGGEVPVDDSRKSVDLSKDLGCSFVPSASLRSAPPAPGEEN